MSDTIEGMRDMVAKLASLRAQLASATEELRVSRLYLKGCMGHFYDETPVSTIAKDVTAEFHRGRRREQDMRAEVDELRASLATVTAERDRLAKRGYCLYVPVKSVMSFAYKHGDPDYAHSCGYTNSGPSHHCINCHRPSALADSSERERVLESHRVATEEWQAKGRAESAARAGRGEG